MLAVIAALGVILTSAYFLQLVRGMLQGTRPPYARSTRTSTPSSWRPPRSTPARPIGGRRRADVDTAEWLTWSPLVVLTVVLGVAPALVLGPVGEAAQAFFGGLG